MKKIKNIAAMGFSLRYPENTMLAYERAFAAGADLVEVDARFTKDRIVVLSHDDSIDRTTDGIGRLDAYTYEELRVFDAAGHFRSGAAFKPGGLGSRGFEHFSFTPVSDLQAGIDLPFSRIPRLEDLLALLKINGGAAIIEIKSRKDAEAGIGAAICALIRQYGLEDRCYVSSFDHEYIHALSVKAPDIRYAVMFIGQLHDAGRYVKALGASMLQNSFLQIDDITRTIRSCARHGIELCVWSPRRTDTAPYNRELLAYGVDGIVTHDPGLVNTLLADL
ncbi:glycerophosphodiester phosphodiesterase family protein [Cohnella ginsengisoli]|uniref:Glycerophosphodiester phosphodiesterase family protein n=1 Tax=Cohnella ginsengisoli TaxID=425004 RepID=A0A9X4QMZ4_9BACL|nr:glycerophosphodiester phosphodiesterase family protein [Cohnella ginsengisoli]MDG0792619.1 glycerophosphodiester phosphodiesterase family protein [Cohnella ginsengisoli]